MKKTANQLLAAWVLLASANFANAQYVKFTTQNNGTNKISIPDGEAWQLVTSCINGSVNGSYFKLGISTNQIHGYLYGTGGVPISMDGASAGGGSQISFAAMGIGSIFVGSYEITPDGAPLYTLVFKKLGNSGLTAGISATSVVIPTSATGDVDIKLEQSADNVTWTECLPGTYNSSTVKRFFRLRAVEK